MALKAAVAGIAINFAVRERRPVVLSLLSPAPNRRMENNPLIL